MTPRACLLAVGLLGGALLLCRPGATSTPDARHAGAQTTPGVEFVGAGSCSASACHNASFAHGPIGSEYTAWISRDPHARAYEVLFNDRSSQMQKRLNRSAPAHEDQRCLNCHVTPVYDAKAPPPKASYFKTDGVSCESCHGPARQWLNVHHLDEWKLRTPAEKKSLGMNDTKSLAGRAQVCVTCHVGAAGMEVDHDLIAAGHPRLHFELAAFHAHLPMHWSEAKDRAARPDIEARLWVAGQLATAKASLELLAHRADPKQKVWPEFAEHDCAACHHKLQDSLLDLGNRKRVALPWGHYVAFTNDVVRSLDAKDDPQLADLLKKIRAEFDAGKPDRHMVAANAKAAAARLDPWLRAAERRGPDSKWIQPVLNAVMKSRQSLAGSGFDHMTEYHLAVTSLHRACVDVEVPGLSSDMQNSHLILAQRLRRVMVFEPKAIHERHGFSTVPWQAIKRETP